MQSRVGLSRLVAATETYGGVSRPALMVGFKSLEEQIDQQVVQTGRVQLGRKKAGEEENCCLGAISNTEPGGCEPLHGRLH